MKSVGRNVLNRFVSYGKHVRHSKRNVSKNWTESGPQSVFKLGSLYLFCHKKYGIYLKTASHAVPNSLLNYFTEVNFESHRNSIAKGKQISNIL